MQRSKSKFSTTAWQWIMLIEIELNWIDSNWIVIIFIVQVKRGKKIRERERKIRGRYDQTERHISDEIQLKTKKRWWRCRRQSKKRQTNKQTWIYACCTFPWIDKQFQRHQLRFWANLQRSNNCVIELSKYSCLSKICKLECHPVGDDQGEVRTMQRLFQLKSKIAVRLSRTINYRLNSKCIKNWMSVTICLIYCTFCQINIKINILKQRPKSRAET